MNFTNILFLIFNLMQIIQSYFHLYIFFLKILIFNNITINTYTYTLRTIFLLIMWRKYNRKHRCFLYFNSNERDHNTMC